MVVCRSSHVQRVAPHSRNNQVLGDGIEVREGSCPPRRKWWIKFPAQAQVQRQFLCDLPLIRRIRKELVAPERLSVERNVSARIIGRVYQKASYGIHLSADWRRR